MSITKKAIAAVNPFKSKTPKAKPLSFDLKQLGKDCVAKREAEGITMRQVRAQVGLGMTQLYNIEAGLASPNADTLAKVIDWLGAPVGKYFVRK